MNLLKKGEDMILLLEIMIIILLMIFDLTFSQEASYDFIHPELSNSSISVELKFFRALADNVEILLLGEEHNFFITSELNVTKNALINYPGHG